MVVMRPNVKALPSSDAYIYIYVCTATQEYFNIFYTSISDVCRRQILTYKTVPAMKELKYF